MSETNQNKLVPKLRFPEFKEIGEWDYPNGNELFEPIVNKRHNSDLPILAITQEQGAIPRDMIDYHVSVTDKSVESYKVVEVGDFIISLRSFQGGIEYSNYKGLCSPAYIILRKTTNIENEFYRHYFKSIPFIRDLNKNLEGIRDGKTISYKNFSDILIPKPAPNEQQKIASCLSSLDEVITAEGQKLDILKEHKKGLLQNLLPQEGETVPKFRFNEFKDSGVWQETTLTQIATFANDKTPLENLSINSYISTENLLPDYAGVALSSKLPTAGNFTKYQKGDVLISNIRPYLKKVWFADKDGACSNDVIVIRVNSIVTDSFLSFLLKNDAFINYIMKDAEGVKMPRGDKDSIKEYPITFPKDKTEQKKIADTLSSIDELINAQSQKVETLKLHKKGLLQGLFPQVNPSNSMGLESGSNSTPLIMANSPQ